MDRIVPFRLQDPAAFGAVLDFRRFLDIDIDRIRLIPSCGNPGDRRMMDEQCGLIPDDKENQCHHTHDKGLRRPFLLFSYIHTISK